MPRKTQITPERLKDAAEGAPNLKVVCDRLGVAYCSYNRIRRIARDTGIAIPASRRRQFRYSVDVMSEEDKANFIYVMSVSQNLKQAAETLGIPYTSRSALKKTAIELGIKVPRDESRLKNSPETVARVLSKGARRVEGKRLKEVIFDLNLLPQQCAHCGVGTEWNGKPLVLQIDHINGNATDNRIENLQVLCPNCHTQTDTWGNPNTSK